MPGADIHLILELRRIVPVKNDFDDAFGRVKTLSGCFGQPRSQGLLSAEVIACGDLPS